jgi:hypothetical protein
MKKHMSEASPQFYARTAGILMVISILAGGFGELFVLSKLMVTNDATATAHNIKDSVLLFRLGFASYLVEAVCDISLAWILYQLLKPVRNDISLLAAFFGLMATATFAFAELFYFMALPLLTGSYGGTFSPDQVNALVLISLKVYAYGGRIFMLFYGIAAMLRGYLIFNSGYLPRFLGLLMIIGGACFVLRNFAYVLAPSYAYDLLLLPLMLSMLVMSLWLLIKGVNRKRWNLLVLSE